MTTATQIPAWIAPGATVTVFHGTQGSTIPLSVSEETIESFTPMVVTLSNGTKFSTDTLTEMGEDEPFQTRIADPASDTTILLTERFNKKRAMEDFEFRARMFKANPSPERAQQVIDSLKFFI